MMLFDGMSVPIIRNYTFQNIFHKLCFSLKITSFCKIFKKLKIVSENVIVNK